MLPAFIMSINFIIGAGFFSMPYVFYHGGILWGALTLIVVTITLIITSNWTLETCSRAQVSSFVIYLLLWLLTTHRFYGICSSCQLYILHCTTQGYSGQSSYYQPRLFLYVFNTDSYGCTSIFNYRNKNELFLFRHLTQ